MEANGSTALAIVPVQPGGSASTQLEPSTAEQAFWLASQLVKSGLLGRSVQRPEAAFAVILAGRELGLTAMQSLRSIHIIEGKPTLSADLMAALVKRSPRCKYFRLVKSTPTIATYATDRDGEGMTEMSFTIDDAKTAGVTNKNNWKTYPAAMLRARCIAQLARAVYPDLLMGIYEEDEISTSTMPETREAAPVAAAPANEPEAPTVDDSVDEESVGYWSERFSSASTIEEVEARATECKAGGLNRATLLAISRFVNTARDRLKTEKKEN